MNRLVAVIGLSGAGKSVVVTQFVTAGFTKIYFGGLTLEKLKEAKLEVNETNERVMREKLRARYGMAVFAKLNIPKIESNLKSSHVVIDGLYSWEEYLVLSKKFPRMEMVAVYAPPFLRYKRLAKRAVRPLTKEECLGRDHAQIENLHQAGPIAMAMYTILNVTTPSELRKSIKEVIDAKKS